MGLQQKRKDAEEELRKVSKVAVEFRSELQTRSGMPQDFHLNYLSKIREQFNRFKEVARIEADTAQECKLKMPDTKDLEAAYLKRVICDFPVVPKEVKQGMSIRSAMSAVSSR